jgi:endonuclease YncB( thermonuclease family)|tara:strand:- start:331 stop:630 length:300 start_codon:yes stop_codon:yes gene_type:complete
MPKKRGRKKKAIKHYVYNAEVLRAVDGDTFIAKIDFGFKIFHENRFRLRNINTPESRGKKKTAKGLEVKEYVKNLIEGKTFELETFKKEDMEGLLLRFT